MEKFDFIITIIESILSLAVLISFIWTFTKEFKLKGFVLSLGGIILIVFCIDLLEKFINYSLDNQPIFIIILLAIIAIFLIWIIIYTIREKVKAAGENKKKFINDTMSELKVLLFSLLIGAVIVGIIVFLLIASDM